LRVINEPKAAALAYGMDKTEDRMWVLFYFFFKILGSSFKLIS
jgi:hypothetical protein